MQNDPTFQTVAWAVFGLLLLIAEVATSTFVLLFFGIAALLVAGARLLGLQSFAIELVVFALLGGIGVAFFRSKILHLIPTGERFVTDSELTLNTEVAPRGEAQVEYQGTTWTVINESHLALQAGEQVRIVRAEGVKLVVHPKRGT